MGTTKKEANIFSRDGLSINFRGQLAVQPRTNRARASYSSRKSIRFASEQMD
jgi:hypothetical protein